NFQNTDEYDKNIQTKKIYRIELGGNNWSETYNGLIYKDYDKAKRDYDSINISDFESKSGSDNYKSLNEYKSKYRFIGTLDAELEDTVDDYLDVLDNKEYWKLIEESESEILETDKVSERNEETDKILKQVESHYDTYGGYKTINLNDEGTKTLKLRIKNHSGKWRNKGFEDYFLSIVIAESDPTSHFHTSSPEGISSDEEFYFDSDYSAEEIIEFIDEKIKELKEEDFEIIIEKMASGGNFTLVQKDVSDHWLEITGMPFYDQILKEPEYYKSHKGYTAKIVYMSPKEYLNRTMDARHISYTEMMAYIQPELVDQYSIKMKQGVKFDMPVLEYAKYFNQEGRHRALAAQKAGLTIIPVLIATKDKEFYKEGGNIIMPENLTESQSEKIKKIYGEYLQFKKEKETQLQSAIKARNKAVNETNSRCGLFGDTKIDTRQGDMFPETFECNATTISNAIKPYENRILFIETELDNIRQYYQNKISSVTKQAEMQFMKNGGGLGNEYIWQQTKREFFKDLPKDIFYAGENYKRTTMLRNKHRLYQSKNYVETIDVIHKSIVEEAIKEGKDVPKNVLNDYPQLKEIYESLTDRNGNDSYKDYKFTYMMLSRLKGDCDYFLGNDGKSRHLKHLYYENIDAQIEEMKRLYNILPTEEKPEWLSAEDIIEYEKKMKKEPEVKIISKENKHDQYTDTIETYKEMLKEAKTKAEKEKYQDTIDTYTEMLTELKSEKFDDGGNIDEPTEKETEPLQPAPYSVIKSKHTKTGKDIWIVRMLNRFDASTYKTIADKVKQN
ncbi:MAG: LPD11 domain-containing protein, partial [bacterium]|nr:LPD11 domain-containing protein [bacterium]